MAKKKRKKWMKPRHRLVRNLLAAILGPIARARYGIRIEKFKEQGKRPYLILYNHQTAFDQFFVGLAFRGPVYYIASEDLFSKGFLSSIIRYLVAPIPILKQTTDVSAVMTTLRVAREGATITLAPEGNRTFSGRTEYIKESVAPLVRALKMPVAIYRLEGGYGVQPRWSDCVRRGKMRGYVSEVIEPEEYRAMTDDELYARICTALENDEGCVDGEYRHKNAAEYVERAVYVCPHCGLSRFDSHGDTVKCLTCGAEVRYLPTKELQGVDRPFPFRFMTEWYRYQCDFVSRLDLTPYGETPIYEDKARFSEVEIYRRKHLIAKEATLAIYGDRYEVRTPAGTQILPFDRVRTATVLGKNKLNLYFEDKLYQFKGDKRFNAIKYVNLYYHAINEKEGKQEHEFLGL
ncbi:MAG: 1-acyl-sn-glycerol-3-phosphate acyltransferase [Clostridia bacterium]|nr:1-acyl-sn-glycerol-3-phosphate acyltransferase [Clostridia bacterium]